MALGPRSFVDTSGRFKLEAPSRSTTVRPAGAPRPRDRCQADLHMPVRSTAGHAAARRNAGNSNQDDSLVAIAVERTRSSARATETSMPGSWTAAGAGSSGKSPRESCANRKLGHESDHAESCRGRSHVGPSDGLPLTVGADTPPYPSRIRADDLPCEGQVRETWDNDRTTSAYKGTYVAGRRKR